MTPRTIHRIGKIKIKLNKRDGVYYLWYPNPKGGRPVLESTGHRATTPAQLSGTSIPAPVRKAADIRYNQYLAGGVPDAHANPSVTVAEAMTLAIRRALGGDDHKANQVKAGKYFGDYLELHHPSITHWNQIAPSNVHAYIEYQASRGVGPKTLRHYLSVITLTSNYWHREDPSTYRTLPIVNKHLAMPEKPEKAYLTLEQALIALDVASGYRNQSYYYVILLGAFAGLNMLEAVDLAPGDINLTAQTVTVTRKKTRFRGRTIPVLTFVTERLSNYVQPYKSTGGTPTVQTLGIGIRRIMDAAAARHPDHAEAFRRVSTRDMRKTFANLAVAARVTDNDLGSYLGHTPRNMTSLAYGDYGDVTYLRERVINPIAEYMAQAE